MEKAKQLAALLLDTAQSASNSIASNISAPVDLLAMGMRGIGLPVPKNAFGGSQWMAENGLTRDVPMGAPQIIGEVLGMAGPMVAAAKAPQIARGALGVIDNALAPKKLNQQTGAIVWHGSPHKFDKFDSSKIGSGEGAQAYGHGLYLAADKQVSLPYMKPAYRDMVGVSIDGNPVNSLNLNYEKYTGARAADRAGGIPQAIEKYTSEVNDALKRGDKRYAEAMQEVLDSVKALPGQSLQRSEDAAKDLYSGHSGSLYKVDLPDEHIAKMLDWDKPMVGQSDFYKQLAKEKELPYRGNTPKGGMDIYKNLVDQLGSQQAATDFLAKQGIPGIRYLDRGSRSAGQGSSNYVVFPGNEGLLKILERNGQGVK